MTLHTVTTQAASSCFSELLDSAQRSTVTVTQHGKPFVVIQSAQREQKRRELAGKRLMAVLKESSAYATKQGMTAAKAEALLADES